MSLAFYHEQISSFSATLPRLGSSWEPSYIGSSVVVLSNGNKVQLLSLPDMNSFINDTQACLLTGKIRA